MHLGKQQLRNLRNIVDQHIMCALMDEPIKSDKWKNLYVHKNGPSSLGVHTHLTEETALKCYEEGKSNPKLYWRTVDNRRYLKSETICFQIPWKD